MKILGLCLFMLSVASVVRADSVVFFNKDTKEVKFIVNDASQVVLSAEDAKSTDTKVIKGKLDLENPISDYKVTGNDLVLNTKKISDRAKIAEDASANAENRRVAKESAKAKLKALGFDDNEVELLSN